MDLATSVLAAAGLVTLAVTIHAAIISWHDREIKHIKTELIKAIRREKRSRDREIQCRNALYAIYEWVSWAQRNYTAKVGSAPAPVLPFRPHFDDSEVDEDLENYNEEEK